MQLQFWKKSRVNSSQLLTLRLNTKNLYFSVVLLTAPITHSFLAWFFAFNLDYLSTILLSAYFSTLSLEISLKGYCWSPFHVVLIWSLVICYLFLFCTKYSKIFSKCVVRIFFWIRWGFNFSFSVTYLWPLYTFINIYIEVQNFNIIFWTYELWF